MGNRRSVRIRRRRRRQKDERTELEAMIAANNRGVPRLGPHYGAGPVHELAPRAAEEEGEAGARGGKGAGDTTANGQAGQTIALPPITTHDSRSDERTVLYGTSIRLRGRTDSGDFNYASTTENVTAVRGTGCTKCSGGDCLRVRGTLIVTYSVNPTVTLPSVSDYPNLTACQRRRVQDAIDNVLAPHEQRHVDAFRTYAGTTRRNFDLTICRSEWNEAAIDAMVKPEQAARQSAAIAASNALDPFFFDVDLDCTDAPTPRPRSQSPGDQPEGGEVAGPALSSAEDQPAEEVRHGA